MASFQPMGRWTARLSMALRYMCRRASGLPGFSGADRQPIFTS